MDLQPHGQTGHVNIYTRDHDSHCTGFGKHNRILAFGCVDDDAQFEVREDLKWGLPPSTCEQRQAAIRRDWRLPRGARLKALPPSRNESSIWFPYEVV